MGRMDMDKKGRVLDDKTIAIRCDHDGLKMGEVKDGHLILRTKHHGETHFKIVQLTKLAELSGVVRREPPVS